MADPGHSEFVRILDANGQVVSSFGGSGGGVSQEDGSAYTPGASDFSPIGGYREDTPTQLADGEGGAVRVTEDRELMALAHLMAWNGSGWDRLQTGLNTGMGGSLKVAIPASNVTLSDGASNTIMRPRSDLSDTMHIGERPFMFNGSTWDRVRGDTTNGLDVDVTRLPTAVQSAFATIDTTPLLRVAVFDDNDTQITSFGGSGGGGGGGQVEGDVAADSADSGNPVKIGGVAGSTPPSSVADGDRVNQWSSIHGAMIVGGVAFSGAGADGQSTIHGIPRINSASGAPVATAGHVFNGSTWDRQYGDTTNGLDVDVTRSALPSGAATAANQSTLIGHVDGMEALLSAIEALLTSIDTDSGGILSAVQTLDNIVAGSEAQVDVITLPATPAGTNLIGLVSAGYNTDVIYQGSTARTVGRAIIDAATSGNNTLLAAQGSGNKIRVHSCFLVAAGAVDVRFESGANGTALTGQMSLVANTGFVLPFNPLGWFETAANTLLNLELGAAVSVDGSFQYSVVQ